MAGRCGRSTRRRGRGSSEPVPSQSPAPEDGRRARGAPRGGGGARRGGATPCRAAPHRAAPRHAAPRRTRLAPPHLALRPAPHPAPHPTRQPPRPAQEHALELLRVDAAAREAAWRAAVSAAKSPRLIAENVADSLRRARSNAGVPCFMRRTSSLRRGVEPAAAGRPQREGEAGGEEHRGWRGQELLEDEGAASATGSGSDEDDADVSFLDSGML